MEILAAVCGIFASAFFGSKLVSGLGKVFMHLKLIVPSWNWLLSETPLEIVSLLLLCYSILF